MRERANRERGNMGQVFVPHFYWTHGWRFIGGRRASRRDAGGFVRGLSQGFTRGIFGSPCGRTKAEDEATERGYEGRGKGERENRERGTKAQGSRLAGIGRRRGWAGGRRRWIDRFFGFRIRLCGWACCPIDHLRWAFLFSLFFLRNTCGVVYARMNLASGFGLFAISSWLFAISCSTYWSVG